MINQETTKGQVVARPFEEAAEWTLARRPALESVVRPFLPVLIRRATVIETLIDQAFATEISSDEEGRSAGMAWLSDHGVDNWEALVKLAVRDLLPELGRSFPDLDSDFAVIAKRMERSNDLSGNLARAWLKGDHPDFETEAKRVAASTDALGFAINWGISAVLGAVRRLWVEAGLKLTGTTGNCPFCGSLPAVAFLARPQGATTEFLTGGGGQKYLHCDLCGHQWRFPRNRCPVCETDDNRQLVYFMENDEAGERIDACRKCGRYLLCVDLREREGAPPMDMAAVGMVHLDVIAQEKGFLPTVWALWNRIS